MLVIHLDVNTRVLSHWLLASDSESEDDVTSNHDVTEETDADILSYKSPDQLSDELVTLSLLPQSRWRNLTNLDIIKVVKG